ncbi:uncharacterized protein N7496_009625 [Penicillium cataractarum]|uniref:Uncharacterized protein n=1 Tax=Penicillium cataractarum TaxID=2100454 RepID=A0A9W9V044_9EURO|nr:uncharacterized protein N7496_009625 [Penicillium cataractarum]KAJ5363912.1 hypothetical protein N7496_009625 [Penicillium cataractarum]
MAIPNPTTITLNPPHHHTNDSKTNPNNKNTPPYITFLTGTWHVTHSSLPLWKDKRNVSITYTPIPSQNASTTAGSGSGDDPTTKLDDLVQYQSRDPSKTKIHTVHGIDTPSVSNPGAWDWRGKGWLMIASSHWEVLGFGEIEPEQAGAGNGTGSEEERNAWVVTYFAKTLFTPAGIDVYSRRKEGVSEDILEGIFRALRGLQVPEIGGLVDGVFEIPRD